MRANEQYIKNVVGSTPEIGIVYETGVVHRAGLMVLTKEEAVEMCGLPTEYPAENIPVWISDGGGWGETWYWYSQLLNIGRRLDGKDTGEASCMVDHAVDIIPWQKELVVLHKPSNNYYVRSMRQQWFKRWKEIQKEESSES